VNSVFLDTVGLLAVWDRSDQWHPEASRAFAALSAEGSRLVTTTYVLAECANAAARRPYRLAPWRLQQELDAAGGLIRITVADWVNAWAAYSRGEAANAGLVDHLSFAVMRRLGIRRAFTNDRHFAAAGMEPLF